MSTVLGVQDSPQKYLVLGTGPSVIWCCLGQTHDCWGCVMRLYWGWGCVRRFCWDQGYGMQFAGDRTWPKSFWGWGQLQRYWEKRGWPHNHLGVEGGGSLIIWGQRKWPHKLWDQGYIGVSGVESSLLELGGELVPQLMGFRASPKSMCSVCLANGHKQPVPKACCWSQGKSRVGWAGGLVVLQH